MSLSSVQVSDRQYPVKEPAGPKDRQQRLTVNDMDMGDHVTSNQNSSSSVER